MAASYRSESRNLRAQLRRLEDELAATKAESDRFRWMYENRPLAPVINAHRERFACVAEGSCQGCAAEVRAQSAEALLAEMVTRHHALLDAVRGQGSERMLRHMRRSGVWVYNL